MPKNPPPTLLSVADNLAFRPIRKLAHPTTSPAPVSQSQNHLLFSGFSDSDVIQLQISPITRSFYLILLSAEKRVTPGAIRLLTPNTALTPPVALLRTSRPLYRPLYPRDWAHKYPQITQITRFPPSYEYLLPSKLINGDDKALHTHRHSHTTYYTSSNIKLPVSPSTSTRPAYQNLPKSLKKALFLHLTTLFEPRNSINGCDKLFSPFFRPFTSQCTSPTTLVFVSLL